MISRKEITTKVEVPNFKGLKSRDMIFNFLLRKNKDLTSNTNSDEYDRKEPSR